MDRLSKRRQQTQQNSDTLRLLDASTFFAVVKGSMLDNPGEAGINPPEFRAHMAADKTLPRSEDLPIGNTSHPELGQLRPTHFAGRERFSLDCS